jgi:hypothetical protein
MAEWFKAAVLKTVVGLHLTGGSNPSLSVVRGKDGTRSQGKDQSQPRRSFVRLEVSVGYQLSIYGKVAEWLKARPC